MAKIQRSNARFISGITEQLTGAGGLVEFVRTGVIRSIKEPIKVKRPNQYK